MGYNCTKPNVLHVLGALETVLRGEGVTLGASRGVDAALAFFGSTP